jgi:hypothetical protein
MTIAADWPTQLVPVMTPDLFDYVSAISTMWSEVELYQPDPDNDIVAWQALFDVDIAPIRSLPWLAQCVGERMPVGLDETQARDWIRQAPNWTRGTEAGIVAAVKRVLTGDRVVQFGTRMRLDGTVDADYVAIVTYATQTPDPQLVRNQLRHYVPFDIVWEYDVLDAATWELVESGMSSWTQLEDTYGPTWSDVGGAQPGFNVW